MCILTPLCECVCVSVGAGLCCLFDDVRMVCVIPTLLSSISDRCVSEGAG